MAEQAVLDLVSRDESRHRKAEGIRLVLENEQDRWKLLVLKAILDVALERRTFTMDHVRQHLEERELELSLGEPHHVNCWGAMMKRATSEGICDPTDRFEKSTRPEAHRRQMQVWRSRLLL